MTRRLPAAPSPWRAGDPALERRTPAAGPARRDFLRYLSRKLAAAVVSFAALLVIGFVIFALMPSDPIAALTRGRPTSADQLAFLRKQLGLDQSVRQQFGHFVANTLQFKLGYSWQFQPPVSSLIASGSGRRYC